MTAQTFYVDGQTYDGYQIGQRLLCRRCGSRLEQRNVQDESGAWQYGVWHCRKCKRPVEAADLVAKPAGPYPIGDEVYRTHTGAPGIRSTR